MSTLPHPAASLKSQTRTSSTEANYLRRALLLEERAARDLGEPTVSPSQVAGFVIAQQPGWAKATWRQNKACLMFRYRAMGTDDALAAVALLESTPESGAKRRGSTTSGLRSKAISSESLSAVVDRVLAENSRYASILASWLQLGAVFGLRPHEWCQATVLLLRPVEAGLGSAEDAPRYYLRVRNAKATNSRSHGEFRHLDLSDCPKSLIDDADRFCQLMTSADINGLYQSYYDGCRKLLLRVNDAMGRSGKARIQIYSARHRFSSVVKASHSTQEVAALMGHATDETATWHYGRRASSGGAGVGPRPVAAEASRVEKRQAALGSDVARALAANGRRRRS